MFNYLSGMLLDMRLGTSLDMLGYIQVDGNAHDFRIMLADGSKIALRVPSGSRCAPACAQAGGWTGRRTDGRTDGQIFALCLRLCAHEHMRLCAFV